MNDICAFLGGSMIGAAIIVPNKILAAILTFGCIALITCPPFEDKT